VAAGKEGSVGSDGTSEVGVSTGKVGWVGSGMAVNSIGASWHPPNTELKSATNRINLETLSMRFNNIMNRAGLRLQNKAASDEGYSKRHVGFFAPLCMI
jgi:hypothetical protein